MPALKALRISSVFITILIQIAFLTPWATLDEIHILASLPVLPAVRHATIEQDLPRIENP